jgi:hypothetical protein
MVSGQPTIAGCPAVGALDARPVGPGGRIALPTEPEVPAESESIVGLRSLVTQLTDPERPALARIAATNAARSYLEAITRNLVEEARKQGATWREIADLFVTSEMNVKARFGDLHDYGDADDD